MKNEDKGYQEWNAAHHGLKLEASAGLVTLDADGDNFYGMSFHAPRDLQAFIGALTAAGKQAWPDYGKAKGSWRPLATGEEVLPGDRYLQDGVYEIVGTDDWFLPCNQKDWRVHAAVTFFERWVPEGE